MSVGNLVGGLFLLMLPSLAAAKSVLAFDLNGAWQRVYDSCGSSFPDSEAQLIDWSRGHSNVREMRILFFDDVYSASFGPSQGCVDISLQSPHYKDCGSADIEGEFQLIEQTVGAINFSSIHLKGKTNSSFVGNWGGVPGGNEYLYQIKKDILVISQRGGCAEGLWSVYFIRLPIM